jgi:RHS repeat-associated protein
MQGAGGVGGLLAVSDHHATTGVVTATHYPAYDGNGNVSEYVNAASGAQEAHFEYDPFGNLTVDTGGHAAAFAFRFSSKPQDPVTGLLYYGYRYYDPLTGRWPARDPIEEDGGVNLYGFVGNDGINWWDRLGWDPQGPTQNGNGSWQSPPGTGRRFVSPPSNNVTPSNSIDPSRGIQGGGPNSPSERGSSTATGAGDAVAGAAEITANLVRIGADDAAEDNARTECEKILASTPCKGALCPNSCRVSYIRHSNPSNVPLSRIFKYAVARPCKSCAQSDDPGASISSTGGPGFPPGTKIKVPQVGVIPPIYTDSVNNSFSVENDCLDIVIE